MKIPPLTCKRSPLSSIFLPLIVIPLGILPTSKAQSQSSAASFISDVDIIDPQFENPQSSSSKTVPCNLSNTGGISTNFRFTFVFGPKVSPLINLGSKE